MDSRRKTNCLSFFKTLAGLSFSIEADASLVYKITLDKNIEEKEESSLSKLVFQELCEYLDGKRKTFTFKYEINATGFVEKVLDFVQTIPYGETRTYADVAKAIEKPRSYRAVGNALNKNPLLIVVPCHRVIRKNGLGGYKYGSEIKRTLLELEGKYKDSF